MCDIVPPAVCEIGFGIISEGIEHATHSSNTVQLSLLGTRSLVAAQTVTAAEIFPRIQLSYGGQPRTDTVDTLKARDPTIKVTGIATTFLEPWMFCGKQYDGETTS